MKSPELLEATASEPLSFEEELEMQRTSPARPSPALPDTRLVSLLQKNGTSMRTVRPPAFPRAKARHSLSGRPVELTFIILARPTPADGAPKEKIPSADEIRTYPMIGDVNLFLPHGVEEDVECEIMIAGASSSVAG